MFWSTLGFSQPSRVLRCIDLPLSSTRRTKERPHRVASFSRQKGRSPLPNQSPKKWKVSPLFKVEYWEFLWHLASILHSLISPQRHGGQLTTAVYIAPPRYQLVPASSSSQFTIKEVRQQTTAVESWRQKSGSQQQKEHVRTEATAASCELAPQQTASCRTAC